MADPNSQNQIWSKWVFEIREAGRHVPKRDVEYNVAKWLRMLFHAPGRVRVLMTSWGWKVEALLEGVAAHDPGLVENARDQFQRHFVEKGWGPLATGKVSAVVLAGDKQDGKPRPQMIDVQLIVHSGQGQS